jgi:hypothetical protein
MPEHDANSDGQLIARFSRPKARRAILLLSAWAVVGAAATVGLAWQVTHPDEYVRSVILRYEMNVFVCAAVTAWLVYKIAPYVRAYLRSRSASAALLIQDGTLISRQWRPFEIALREISTVTSRPRDRLTGRPEQLKITTADGSARLILCDLLDRSSEEIARSVVEAQQTSA